MENRDNLGRFVKGHIGFVTKGKRSNFHGNSGSFFRGQIPWNKGKGIWGNCKECNNSIWIENNLIGRKKFCSKMCFFKGRELKGLFLKGHKDLVPKEKRGHTENTKIKISISSKGKYKGKLSWNWKGGIRGENYLQRRVFRGTLQKKVFERDNYTCQLCGSKKDLQVDHIKSWAEYVELRFSMDNCRTLCAKCHYEITYKKPMPDNIRGWGHNLMKGRIKE